MGPMTEHTTLFEHAGARYEVPELPMEDLLKRRDRKRRAQRITAGVVGVAVFVVAIWIVASITSSDRSQKPVAPIAPPPKGIFSGIGGWITLQRVDGIGAVAPDGSDKTVLLHGRDVAALDWSPDGSRLLVARHGKALAVIEPDGSETTLIRFDDDTYMDTHVAGASFSPDGSTVVYATNPGKGKYPGQMWTVASDGSGEPTLLLESGGHACGNGATCFTMLYEPTYSPDGSQIAFADGFGDSTHTLRVVNADGTDVRVLIDATPPFDEIGHLAGLAWSPDGSVLALAS